MAAGNVLIYMYMYPVLTANYLPRCTDSYLFAGDRSDSPRRNHYLYDPIDGTLSLIRISQVVQHAVYIEDGIIFFVDDGPNVFGFDFEDPLSIAWNVVNNLEGNGVSITADRESRLLFVSMWETGINQLGYDGSNKTMIWSQQIYSKAMVADVDSK